MNSQLSGRIARVTQLGQAAGGVESCRFRIREPGSLLGAAIEVVYYDRTIIRAFRIWQPE